MLNTILINVFALLLSFGIFAGHYTGKTSFDLALFSTLISEHAIILIFLFIISSVSLYLYNSDDRYNKRVKNKFSLSVFRLISKFIHVTTIIIVSDSLLLVTF